MRLGHPPSYVEPSLHQRSACMHWKSIHASVCCMIVRKLHARAGCEHEEPHNRHVEGSAAMAWPSPPYHTPLHYPTNYSLPGATDNMKASTNKVQRGKRSTCSVHEVITCIVVDASPIRLQTQAYPSGVIISSMAGRHGHGVSNGSLHVDHGTACVSRKGQILHRTAKALPMSEWQVADIAHGNAVSGSAKFLVARTTPSAEFCMPVSMATVLDTCVFSR